MVMCAGMFWSLQGPTIRFIEVGESGQIVFWRSVSQMISILLIVTVVNRGRVFRAFRVAGVAGLLGGLCGLGAGTSFVFALAQTTVANVVFIMAAAPMFAALLAWLILGERLDRGSYLSMTLAIVGIGVMVSEGLQTGAFLGYLFAIVTTICFAGIAVVARYGRGLSMLPSTCIGAFLTMPLAFWLSSGSVALPPHEIGLAFVSGGLLTSIGATLFMLGARYVAAGLLAFLSLTEIVLAPIWVWWVFDEVPSSYTLLGGAVVLSALVIEGIRRARG